MDLGSNEAATLLVVSRKPAILGKGYRPFDPLFALILAYIPNGSILLYLYKAMRLCAL